MAIELLKARLRDADPLICPNCGGTTLHFSRWRRRDGLRQLLFYTAFTCNTCGHRHSRLSVLAVAAIPLVVLMLALFVAVGWVFWTHAQNSPPPPLQDTRGR